MKVCIMLTVIKILLSFHELILCNFHPGPWHRKYSSYATMVTPVHIILVYQPCNANV